MLARYNMFVKGAAVLSKDDWEKWKSTFARKHNRHVNLHKSLENAANAEMKKSTPTFKLLKLNRFITPSTSPSFAFSFP